MEDIQNYLRLLQLNNTPTYHTFYGSNEEYLIIPKCEITLSWSDLDNYLKSIELIWGGQYENCLLDKDNNIIIKYVDKQEDPDSGEIEEVLHNLYLNYLTPYNRNKKLEELGI